MGEPAKWHQTLPAWIAVIVTVVVQTVAVTFFLAGVRADVDRANGAIERQDIRLKDVEGQAQRMAVGAATVGAQLQSVQDSISELKEETKQTNALLRDLIGVKQ
jgi:peptidoglycan hydrolase CwlO-like protein